ncbi:MAG: HD domain-containing protein [Candidatus Omnitrophica bacterium]|nr:HD domain-containing protein [Candidatus Omnitrophota bacterium]
MILTLYLLPPFLAGLCALTLSLFVLSKNKIAPLNRSVSLLFFCITVWQFGNAISWALEDRVLRDLSIRLLYLGVAFLPAATYHFSVEFTNLQKQRVRVPLVYLFCTLLLILVFHPSFISGYCRMPWGWHVLVGVPHTVFLFLWLIPMILAFLNLYIGYRSEKAGFERRRRRFILLCFCIGCFGVVDYIPNYGGSVSYPMGFIFLILLMVGTTYSIVQYRLLTVNIIIRKASIITSLCVVAAIGIHITSYYIQPYLYNLFGANWIFFPVSIAFMFGIGLFRLIDFVKQMEVLEFSRRADYRPILKKTAERIAAVKNIDEFLVYLVRDLSSWVRLDYVGIMVLDHHHKEFVLMASHTRSKSRQKVPKGLVFSMDSALVVELLRKRNLRVRQELKYYLDTQIGYFEDRSFTAEIIDDMERLGASISIPCFCEGKLLAIVNIGQKLEPEEVIHKEDLELFSSLSNNVARAIHDFMLKQEKIELIVASQHILITVIEAKDPYTCGHSNRVAHYAGLIGKKLEKELRLFRHGVANLNWAAQLHDLGKIGVPDGILHKQTKLSEEEWEIVKRHTVDGLKILEPMRGWLNDDICAGVEHHHENFDGSGYPSHQQGEEIHFFARIIRVADAFDAMTTDRPYREALTKSEAVEELRKSKGAQFDPYIVDKIVELFHEGEI